MIDNTRSRDAEACRCEKNVEYTVWVSDAGLK